MTYNPQNVVFTSGVCTINNSATKYAGGIYDLPVAVSGSPADYGTGVTLTATVSAGATGWVSFRQGGAEIGAAPLVSGIAAL